MHTGKALRKLIFDRNIKNSELADGVGVKPSQVTEWVKNERMSLRSMDKIAKFFDMKLSEFIKLSENE